MGRRKPIIANDGLAERADWAAKMIREGEIVGMVGVSLYKDGTTRFWAGGKAAEDHRLASALAKELVKSMKNLLH